MCFLTRSAGLPRTVQVACKPAQAPPEDVSEDNVVWDPSNLLKGERLSKGHIEKRLAERKAKMGYQGPRNMIISAAAENAGPDGILFSQIENTINERKYADHVDVHYMGIGEEFHDRIRVLNIDPPVFVIDSFLPIGLCGEIVEATQKSELLQRSKIGGGVLTDEGLPVSQTRTSTSLLIDSDVQKEQPRLKVQFLPLQFCASIHCIAQAMLLHCQSIQACVNDSLGCAGVRKPGSGSNQTLVPILWMGGARGDAQAWATHVRRFAGGQLRKWAIF